MKDFKERINYVIESGYYIGYSVNLPIIVQAKSMEDLKHKTKVLCNMWVQEMQKTLSQDEPFEFVETENINPCQD